MPIPPMDSVTLVGSPENSSLYSGVLANLQDAVADEVVHEFLNLFLCIAPFL